MAVQHPVTVAEYNRLLQQQSPQTGANNVATHQLRLLAAGIGRFQPQLRPPDEPVLSKKRTWEAVACQHKKVLEDFQQQQHEQVPWLQPPFLPTEVSVLSQLWQQRTETAEYLRLQEEKLIQLLTETSSRHSVALLRNIDNLMAGCSKQKSARLQELSGRNKELENKLQQLTLEARIWQRQAMDYEGLALRLRNSLLKEGCGDNGDMDKNSVSSADERPKPDDDHDEESPARLVPESQDLRDGTACKRCRNRESCVLLLPCRHLCLCKACEATSDACPICWTYKDASFQVLFT